MNETINDMKQIMAIQEYLKGLYEAYDVFQEDYKNQHRRSKMHDIEPVAEYYLRWRNKMRIEIRSVEIALMKLLPSPCKPCINTKFTIGNGGLVVKNFRLQNVGNFSAFAYHY
jgi:hypothetical protein